MKENARLFYYNNKMRNKREILESSGDPNHSRLNRLQPKHNALLCHELHIYGLKIAQTQNLSRYQNCDRITRKL